MRTFPFLSLVPLRIVSRISLSVVSSDHFALVKSGTFSLRPFSVSPRPSSPWQATHLAFVNTSLGSCVPGATCSGGAVGACCKGRGAAAAARDKGSSLLHGSAFSSAKGRAPLRPARRSEEHTSELQSQSN